MKRFGSLVAALAVAAFVTTAVNAEEKCDKAKCCPIASAMKDLPQMVYKVGKETTTCAVTAGRLARKQDDAKVQYMVGKKEFKDEQTAFTALVSTTEKFVDQFASPAKCSVSGKTKVAGKELCCDVAAAETTKLVKKALETVKVSYRVGDEEVCCPDAAKALAKKTGKEVVPCLAGKKGGCGLTSRLAVAQAKYKAIVEALAAADKKQETTES